MTAICDVLVVGGGPAGLATSIALRRLGRSVIVLEKTHYHRPRTGETFGPELKQELESLGAWEDFTATEPVPFRGVVSAWGSSSITERPSIFHPLGEGWHVDRVRFDQVLAAVAARGGAVLHQDAALRSLTRTDALWLAGLAGGEEIRARYLVDASGRGAPATLGHVPERKWLRADRQVAVLGLFKQESGPLEPVLLLEAVEEGWWYSVPQPGGNLLTVLITDGDLLPARGARALREHFLARLKQSVHTSARNPGAEHCGQVWIGRSDSGLLLPDRGPGWRAVGDAAMACDPLTGDGVVRNLRMALEVAPQIHDALATDAPPPHGQSELPQRFLDYQEMRGRYYAVEGRWPDASFWARRRPIPWKEADIFLDPRALLQWQGAIKQAQRIAAAETLIPPAALSELPQHLTTPQPAHQVMHWLRSNSPASDRQLLVGLQLLVELGCVSVAA